VSGLAAALRAEGGLLAAVLAPADPAPQAAGGRPEARAAALEAVQEGWRLHGGGAPAVVTGADPDLALLGGDRLYALGLERLAAEGDVEAVGVLAEAIAVCARALAEDEPERARAAWSAAAASLASQR
jgi:hypothetical protein